MSDGAPEPDGMPAFLHAWYGALPRQGPGSEASTLRALAALSPLPDTPHVLDVGAGTGAATVVLARATGGTVTATDVHAPYLDLLRERAREAGVGPRVGTVVADMAELPFPSGVFDLVWSEGAIYLVGFERGLRLWRRLLREGGALAVTELSWLVDDPPPACRAFWDAEYPAMRTVRENLETIEACGYASVEHFTLPSADWTGEFYVPLASRLTEVRADPATSPAELEAAAATQTEIDLFRRFEGAYGYVFYAMRPRET